MTEQEVDSVHIDTSKISEYFSSYEDLEVCNS